MFDELDKYKKNDHFFFEAHESLERKCNAPKDKSGIFLVYALKGGRIELVYVGSSGSIDPDGSMFVSENGLGGIKEEIVNGLLFDEIPNKTSWAALMERENIEALDVYWYVTHDKSSNDAPELLEDTIIERHFDIYGQVPTWNHGI